MRCWGGTTTVGERRLRASVVASEELRRRMVRGLEAGRTEPLDMMAMILSGDSPSGARVSGGVGEVYSALVKERKDTRGEVSKCIAGGNLAANTPRRRREQHYIYER